MRFSSIPTGLNVSIDKQDTQPVPISLNFESPGLVMLAVGDSCSFTILGHIGHKVFGLMVTETICVINYVRYIKDFKIKKFTRFIMKKK